MNSSSFLAVQSPQVQSPQVQCAVVPPAPNLFSKQMALAGVGLMAAAFVSLATGMLPLVVGLAAGGLICFLIAGLAVLAKMLYQRCVRANIEMHRQIQAVVNQGARAARFSRD
jgi:hypothetical protein